MKKLLISLILVSCAPALTPCSEADAVMVAKAAECRQRVQKECPDLKEGECPVGEACPQCPVIEECDAWGDERCGK